MKRLFLILGLMLASAMMYAQVPKSASFGLAPNDDEAVRKMRHRMDSIRKHRPTVALVLSGGGAKGAATIGAMKYLQQFDIPIDIVAGTSVGGLIGGLYALGYDTDYLDDLIHNMDWNKALSDVVEKHYIPYNKTRYKEKYLVSIPFYYRTEDYERTISGDFSLSKGLDRKFKFGATTSDSKNNLVGSLPSGFVYGQNVNQIFTSRTVGYSGSADFLDFPIPFICVATDLVTSRSKVWHDGSINHALRSTMSIPGLFVPVRADGMVLVDGGMRNNYPVNLVKTMGADIVIGIELSGSSYGARDIKNLGDMLMQGMDLFSNDVMEISKEQVDVSIHPNVEGYDMLSFDSVSIDTLFARGFRAAELMAPQLDSIKAIVGSEGFKLHAKPAIDIDLRPVVIDSIKVLGVPEHEEEYIISKMYIKPNSIVNKRIIEEDVAKIFGSGAYDFVNYELWGDEEPYKLVIICQRGPMHQFGMGVRLDSENIVSLLLNFGLNTNALSGHSLDFTTRVSANPYLNIHYAYNAARFAAFNVTAQVRYTDRNHFLYGSNVFNLSFIEATQKLYVSNMHWSDMDFGLGLRGKGFRLINVLSSEVIEDYEKSTDFKYYPSVFAEGRVETLDNTYFPKRGVSAGFSFDLVSRYFYPKESGLFAIAEMDFLAPITFGRFSLIPRAQLRFLFGNNVPLFFGNVIGGDLPGQYIDQQMAFIGLGSASFRRNYLTVGRLDARVNIGKNHYVTLMGNVCYDFASLQKISGGDFISGLGLGYAYNSVFGPLKMQLHWSTYTKRVGIYISMGYSF